VKTSDKGIHVMHLFEGYRNKPYLCPAHLWTVGYGEVLYHDQIKLPIARKEGYTGPLRKDYPLKDADNRIWSKEEINDRFKNLLVSFERGVLRLAPNLSGNQGLFDACVCLSYNIGVGGFQRSTLRQRILRDESLDRIADGFMMYTKAGGKELAGLVRRRKAEVALFMQGDNSGS
jgi:lysozyme